MLINNTFGNNIGMEKSSFLMVNQIIGGLLNIDSVTIDTEGRFLLLDCRISNIKYILVNLYAPTADTKLEQNNFGNYVNLILRIILDNI